MRQEICEQDYCEKHDLKQRLAAVERERDDYKERLEKYKAYVAQCVEDYGYYKP